MFPLAIILLLQFKLLRVPWTAKRSNQSVLKEISPGCSLEGMMLKVETPVLWLPHATSWLIGKDSDAGRDWGQEEKGTTEDEMAGWHHWLDGRESVWTPGDGDGQGGPASCDSWGRKELDTTEWLNWTELNGFIVPCIFRMARGESLWCFMSLASSSPFKVFTWLNQASPGSSPFWWI